MRLSVCMWVCLYIYALDQEQEALTIVVCGPNVVHDVSRDI